jgi:hypothetical protein
MERRSCFRKFGIKALVLFCLVVQLPFIPGYAQKIPDDLPVGAFVVFGPKDYGRSTGKPEAIIETFTVQNPGDFYILRAYNGGDEGQFEEKISSVFIILNETERINPKNFNQTVDMIDIPIELEKNNEISIENRSKPESGLTLIIFGVDNDPPKIKAIPSPSPNAAGWNNTDVTVSFICSDDKSGIQSCPGPVTVTTEGAGQVITGTAVDNVGNTASASVTLNIDKTPPTITANVDRPPDYDNWYTDDVTVSFECNDTLSLIKTCPGPIVADTDGANQVITGTAKDIAGNTASASVTLNVDTSPPTIVAHVDPPPNAAGWNNTDVTVSFECADQGSGIASCSPPVAITDEGADQAISGTATDLAGHSNDVTVTVNLDKTPPNLAITTQAEAPALEIAYTSDFTQHTSYEHGNSYKPIPPAGFYSLGDYIEGIEGDLYAHGVSATVKELTPGALAKPDHYEKQQPYEPWAWTIWVPIPPSGYRCLGVLLRSIWLPEPSLDEIRCVQEELTAPTTILLTEPDAWFLFPGNPGIYWGVWELLPADDTGLYLGTFTANDYAYSVEGYPQFTIRDDAVKQNSWVSEETSSVNGTASDNLSGIDTVSCNGSPVLLSGSTFTCDVSLQAGQNDIDVSASDIAGNTTSSTEVVTYAQEALEVAYTTTFTHILWDDRGSEGSYNVTYLKPGPPEGYYVLGHYGQSGYGYPVGISLTAKELVPGALAKPAGYKMVWHDAGSGADMNAGIWKAIPAPGYRCLGLVVVPDYNTPNPDLYVYDFRCVRKELTAPGRAFSEIWKDEGTGSYRNFGSWQVAPADGNGLPTGTFTGHQSYNKPYTPMWVINKQSVAGSVELSEAEINAAIDAYSPILAIYPFEPYIPDDPEYILDHAQLCWAIVQYEYDYDAHSKYSLDCMQTSSATLMTDVAQIENEHDPGPIPYQDAYFRIWLEIPDDLKWGSLDRAKPLVNVRPLGPYTEIQYWFFYPFNGQGRLEICIENGCSRNESDGEPYLKESGRHYGDWEMVTTLIKNDTQELFAVGLSQHGDIEWLRSSALYKWAVTHPFVFPGIMSHANYPLYGEYHYMVVKQDWWGKATLFDQTSGYGTIFKFEDFYMAGGEKPTLSPDWLNFPYRWGQYLDNWDEVCPSILDDLWCYNQKAVESGPTGPAMKGEW